VAILGAINDLSSDKRQSIAQDLGLPGQFVVSSAGRDPEGVWREATAISNPNQRVQTQMGVAVSWAQSDPMAALWAAQESRNEQMRLFVQMQILQSMLAGDGMAQLVWVESQPEGQCRDQLMSALVRRLAEQDPERAQSLIARLPETHRDQVELSLWNQRAAEDPEGATAWVSARNDGGMREVHQMMAMLSTAPPEIAERLFQALLTTARAQVETTYVQLLARTDPDRAAKRVDQITEPDRRLAAAQSLVSGWSEQDPQAARRWIEQQPGDSTPMLWQILAMSWGRTDPAATRNVADSMDAGCNRDLFVLGMIASTASDAEEATALIDRIGDAKLREQALKTQDQLKTAMEGMYVIDSGVR